MQKYRSLPQLLRLPLQSKNHEITSVVPRTTPQLSGGETPRRPGVVNSRIVCGLAGAEEFTGTMAAIGGPNTRRRTKWLVRVVTFVNHKVTS